jgi:peptide/nickel transport system ATP-binding protein
LASTVGADNKGQPLQAVPGAPPDMSNPPAGCAFAPRCSRASDICRSEAPPTEQVEGRSLACWFPLVLEAA